MVAIVFLYFIGKAFYELAEEHDKRKWLWAILGVLSYYISAVILGIIMVILYDLLGIGFDIETMSEAALTIVTVVVGLLSCWGFYYFLKANWERSHHKFDDLDDNILDDF